MTVLSANSAETVQDPESPCFIVQTYLSAEQDRLRHASFACSASSFTVVSLSGSIVKILIERACYRRHV